MRASRILIIALAAAASLGIASEPGRIMVHPADTGAALVNPGMGWVLHHYDNSITTYGSRLAPSDTVDDFPGVNVVYLRLAWSYIEPEEGKFNWSIVDTPAQRWVSKGKQVAFRFTCSESSLPNATPDWVRKAGAKVYHFRPRKCIVEDSPQWEPDFDDPIFLAKLDHFLAAAAERYDGNPEVAFIDVGSYGVWGEGHTSWSSCVSYPASTIRKHIDLYVKHFKHTQLEASHSYAGQPKGPGGLANIDYARDRGMGLRTDSVLVFPEGHPNDDYFTPALAKDFWPKVPVVIESQHYGNSRDQGYWKDGSRYLKAVEEYHASYASVHWWPREFLAENRELVDKINRRLGYRLQLVEASWPSEVTAKSTLQFASRWKNAGVAPCLPGGYPALTLKDDQGGIVGVFTAREFDVRSLPVGPPGEADQRSQEKAFSLPPILKPGVYQVYVSVGTRTGTPRIALPLANEDGARRYRLGAIRVVEGGARPTPPAR
jgi:uncharacterized protein DUF4832/glycosyl hydrolase family 42 (putative beta-galactosidase)